MASQAFEAAMEQLNQDQAHLDSIRSEVSAIKEHVEKQNERLSELLAERRRKGQSGKAWQVLQQRIDMRQTTESDIISGIDKSAEAREVRAMMRKTMSDLKQGMNAAKADGKSELGAMLRDLDEASARLRSL